MRYQLVLGVLSTGLQFASSCATHSEKRQSYGIVPLPDRDPGPITLKKIAIKDVDVFDGYSMKRQQTIILDRGIIGADIPYRDIDEVVDGRGKVLIPGLIDAHSHPVELGHLEALSRFGVTTTFSMSCWNQTICHYLKDQPGLTSMYTAGYPAVGPGSAHAQQHNVSDSDAIHKPAQAIDWVDWVIGNSSDFLKMTAEANGPTQDTQNALVKAAHMRGLQAMTHASGVKYYKQAIIARTDGIQHAPADGLLDQKWIDRIVAQRQYVTPTMNAFWQTLDDPEALAALEGGAFGNYSYAHVRNNVQAMYRAGVPLLVGTDSVGYVEPFDLPFGISVHWEMQHLVQAGLSEVEALQAATRLPAAFHGYRDRGVIAPGNRADVILLNSDPTKNITNTMDIDRVWITGVEFKNVANNSTTVPS